jgi:Flp pilus assembly pilin Flp
MKPLKEFISAWIFAKSGNQKGTTLVEYSLLLILVAFLLFMVVQGVGESTKNKYSTFNSEFSNATNK